jgi:uncharacterized protein
VQRTATLADRIAPVGPAGVQLTGYLGRRVAVNDAHLALVDLEPLLAGFRDRPGSHPWIGEHIGKWLHAASLTYERTRDAALGSRMQYALDALLATQEADGYLGTYPPDRRFGLYEGADWDVWVHKYVLIGVLAYLDATDDERALDAARRIGDLLDTTFRTGRNPARIIDAGTHVGMAATSILEPIVGLYRRTGEERYLAFAWSILEAWDLPGGPHVLSTLRATGRVREVGNGKAYEMLSNLVGLCELARASGDRSIVSAVVRGWDDIVANHRYVTGGASHAEHFGLPGELPNPMSINVAETCVTVTWLQLTHQLLRLTGEARFADELERTVYNQLLAAQHPDGRTWCYYTALEGTKPYGPGISCCVSSGPRGVAMIPGLVYGRTADDRLTVVLHESSTAPGIEQTSSLTAPGRTTIKRSAPGSPGMLLRDPAWADVAVEGSAIEPNAEGWLAIDARAGRRIEIELDIEPRRLEGTRGDAGKVAEAFGPFVLAYRTEVAGHDRRTPTFDVVSGDEVAVAPPAAGEQRITVERRLSNRVDGIDEVPVGFVPFAEAGADGSAYRIWVAATELDTPVSLLGAGVESRAAGVIGHGSVVDYEPTSFASTYDGADHGQDWFAVTVEEPVAIRRIVVGHGWSWVNGGWFDASAMRPLLEVRATPDGPWHVAGELADYPATTASDPGGLRGGERFTVVLPERMRVVAVRVRGRGSYGDYPPGRYTTCSELSAYAD